MQSAELAAHPTWILFAGAGLAFYFAARFASDALVGARALAPGRIAIGHWIPIAVLSLLAIVFQKPEVAIGLIFATSVAAVSLAAGVVGFITPVSNIFPDRARTLMLLPAAFAAFLVGFQGHLTDLHVEVLLGIGLVSLIVWLGAPQQVLPAGTKIVRLHRGFSAVQLILCIALAGIGAWAALHGITTASATSENATPGVVTTMLLGPLLILPLLGNGIDLAHQGEAPMALSALVGVVLLNLCLLFPAVILEGRHHPVQRLIGWASASMADPIPAMQPATAPASQPVDAAPTPEVALAFPLAVWRVDALSLVILCLFLFPAILQLWPISRAQGFALLLGYLAYLLLSVLVNLQRA